jgi:quercetin dioxygenase-like cupin family protein
VTLNNGLGRKEKLLFKYLSTMKRLLYIILVLITITTNVVAQDDPVFAKGEISTADNHTGTVWLKELNHPDSIFNLSLAHATFAPGAKLDWHIHPAGQYLLITEGIGYYQEKGKPIQLVYKGDVIKCLPGVEHWHGAAPGNSFAYVGVTPTQKGKTIWAKRVTDEEYNSIKAPAINSANAEQEIINLSKNKWQWMADKNVDSLKVLFDDKSMFIHMGGSWGKDREIDVIKSGGIWYKKAEVYTVLVNIIGNTAILLNDIDLVAEVGGNEVINPFMVTEVYIKENGKWRMGSLTFSRLTRPVKMNK